MIPIQLLVDQIAPHGDRPYLECLTWYWNGRPDLIERDLYHATKSFQDFLRLFLRWLIDILEPPNTTCDPAATGQGHVITHHKLGQFYPQVLPITRSHRYQ